QAPHAQRHRRALGHHARGHRVGPESGRPRPLPRRRPHRDPAARCKKKDLTLAGDLWLSPGTAADWPYFARWHYRSHRLAFTRRVVLLWHGAEPVGICVFATPAASLRLRSRFFGLTRPPSRQHPAALNDQLSLLARVVLPPTHPRAG